MNNNQKTVVSGAFRSEKDLSQAMEWLDAKGISKDDISILVSDKNPGKDFKINTSNKVPEIAVKGLTTGTIFGAVFGALSIVGILIIPAIGIAITGPVIGAVAGIAIGGLAGGIIGTFIGISIPEYEAVFFDDKCDRNILLVTKVDKSFKNETKKNFTAFGATNIAAQ